jgi:hypothetical protein
MIGNGLARALLHATNRLVERRTKQAPAYSDACAQVTPGFAHPHGKHAGDIRLWTLSQEWLAVHHVIDGLRDVGGMIAHALDIFVQNSRWIPKVTLTGFSIIYTSSRNRVAGFRLNRTVARSGFRSRPGLPSKIPEVAKTRG